MPAKKSSPSHQAKTSSHLPTALVAGAAGFIGSHLCDALIHQNCRVYGLDNWTTGKKDNLKHLLKNSRFVFLDHDLNKPLKSPPPQLDYIFHLAGIEAYVNGLDVSLETLLVNSLGTRELLEIAKKQSSKFLLVSTADIFSGFVNQKDLTQYFGTDHQKEELYSHHEAKRFSEALVFEYLNRYQIDTRIIRLANAYGPRMDLKSGHTLTNLLLAAHKNKPLKISGQGLTPIYPTYISDIIFGLTKAMFSQSSSGKIFTLVNPQKTTTLNLAYQIKKILSPKDIKIDFISGEDDLSNPVLSDQTIDSQKDLGWSPKVSLEQGIINTLKWLKSGSDSFVKDTDSVKPKSIKPEPAYTPESLGLQPALPPDEPASPDNPTTINILRANAHKTIKKLPLYPANAGRLKLSLPRFSRPKLSLKPRPKNLKPKTKIILAIFALMFFWITIPLVLLASSTYAGVTALNQASQLTDFSQIDKLESLTARAQNRFDFSRKILRSPLASVKVFGLKDLSLNLDRLLFIGTKLSQGAYHLAEAGESGTLLTNIVFHHQDGNITEALKRISINLDQAYSELSFVESELQSGRQLSLDITSSLVQKFQTLTTQLPVIREKIDQARTILPLVPSFIAQDSKKTYLLLFQNSAELRPTGGFIGSYGLLTFEQGKLLDLDVQDIYTADGQLQGYVEPPEPIKEFLGQNTWFFRDSNWDPDFTVSAARAEWFLNKTTNRNVDGVIAVNLPSVKLLLEATGPISIPDFNEEVNADNLFERAEYQSEINFFPGSTQKKDFLGALARELFNFAKNSSAADLLKLSQAVEIALSQKQLLIYLHDQDSQRLLLEQNWAGSLFTPTLTTLDNRPVLSDYTYLVEANLGINKSNYFLKRDIQQQLTILKNKQILVSTTINYQNQSPADAWPGGVYRSYLRDYIPLNSQIISIKVGDSKLDLKDLDKTNQLDKTIIGFPITVPVKNTLTVEITYRLQKPLELKNSQGRLAVIIPKQPGILDDPLEVIVNHPTYLTVAATSPQTLVSPQVVSFQSNLETDRLFLIDFIEK